MSLPVIIPAANEAPRIRRTLDSLAYQSGSIEPIIVVNNCTDDTADVIHRAGAEFIESEPGKMRAIQKGLTQLGRRALDTVVLLDADTRPMSRDWSVRLRSNVDRLSSDQPAITWGPVAFFDDLTKLVGVPLTAYTTNVSWSDRNDDDPRTIRGCNMALRLQNLDVLDQVLSYENYWPREDVAIYDAVMQAGGHKRVDFHPKAWARTSGHRYQPLTIVKKQLADRRHPSRLADEAYAARTPAGAIPYNSPYTRRQNKNPDLANQS